MAKSLQKQFDNFLKSKSVNTVLAENAEKILEEQTERMADILRNNVSAYNFLNHIEVSGDITKNISGGSVELSGFVEYDEGEVHRESWYPEAYGQGADLFTLFNYGYDAKDYVYGPDGRKSLRHRDSANFIENALNEFNNTAPAGVVATALK